MNAIFSSNQIVEHVRESDKDWEVFASADATYDQGRSAIDIDLDVYLRTPLGRKDEILRVPWLPHSTHIVEHAPRPEASQVAHEVFANWVAAVRKAIPPEFVISAAEPFGVHLHRGGIHT